MSTRRPGTLQGLLLQTKHIPGKRGIEYAYRGERWSDLSQISGSSGALCKIDPIFWGFFDPMELILARGGFQDLLTFWCNSV